MPPRTTFALADRQKDSCLHPSRPKRNIIQKEKAGNAPSLAHEKGHRQTDRQTHRQTTTTLIASGPPLRGDPYFVCISTTLLRNNITSYNVRVAIHRPLVLHIALLPPRPSAVALGLARECDIGLATRDLSSGGGTRR